MRKRVILIAGDILTLGVITVTGFATHGTAGSAGIRMLTTLLPLVIAWFLVSPHLGAYDQEKACQTRQLWRPFWAMILAAPLAAWMRGAWLNMPILPLFVVVLGGFSALGLLFWRLIFLWVFSRT